MSKSQGYDLIGDVHGCMMTLVKLLDQLGYSKRNGVYQHANRQVIFIGDIVDRGPRIRESLHIVRDMVEHGSAHIVMGNHEYNALGYCTRARAGSTHTHLREHNERHERLIRETLDQFEGYSSEWSDFLGWFYQLPLFLEMEGFRVVHACWDDHLITQFKAQFGGNRMNEDFLHASTVKDSFAGQVMDKLLRGTDMRLPNGESITGSDGFTRHFFRTKFWNNKPEIYQDIVFQPDPLPRHIAHHKLTDNEKQQLLSYDASLPPVFVGHYWMSGPPEPIQSNIACLDYSAVKYGKLVAYRMDGEQKLSKDKFVWVDVIRPEM